MEVIFSRRLFLVCFALAFVLPPAFSRVMVTNGLTHEFNVTPGMEFKQVIELFNTGSQEQTVLLSQTDYHFSHTGEAAYGQPGRQVRSNANWIELSQNTVILQPNVTRSVVLDLKMPSDSTLFGTYWSVVMIEMAAIPTSSDTPGISMQAVVRYAVQVITHIGTSGKSNIVFLETHIETIDSLLLFSVDIENTGDIMLRHTVLMEVYDELGNKAGEFVSEQRRSYPGTSVRATLDISPLLPGTYQAYLYADCENDDFFGTIIQLEVPHGIPKH